VKAWIHPCFTLALDGGKWSVSYSQPLYTHKLEKEGWVSPTAGLDAANRKISSLCQEKNPFFSHWACSLLSTPTEQSAPPECLTMKWQKWSILS